MAFTDQTRDERRLAKLIAVSTFHVALAYGLVNGLAVAGFREYIPYLPTENYPADPTPTPEIEPVEPRETKPVTDPPLRPASDLPDLSGLGLTGTQPTFPDAGPLKWPPPRPPVTPSFTPKQASPRNDPGLWVSTGDYPPRDIREGNEGTTNFLLSIDPGGKVRDCRILASSGYPSLDEAACRNITRRARFDPARDGAGEKVSGTYSSNVRWVIPKE